MAWTQSDLDKLQAAYVKVASGPQSVEYADGRKVTYNSPNQIESAIKVVEAQLTMAARSASGLTRRRFGVFRSGT